MFTFSDRGRLVLRAILFTYVAFIFCPIRYYPITGGLDNTWIFALNYAAAHGLRMGRDVIFTSGPLSFLFLPQDIGSNLVAGLIVQLTIWVPIIAILWQLFFRSGLSLANLVFFSILQGLAAPLYWVNTYGVGDLVVTVALILLLQFHLRGGSGRFLLALAMLGLVPLMQFAGVLLVAGIVAGLIVNSIMERRTDVCREILLAAAVPLLVTGIGYSFTLRSLRGIAAYLRSSVEISSGYNFAMSAAGTRIALLAACEVLGLFAIAAALLAVSDRRTARLLVVILAVPLFVSFKHGFVRQDLHISIFFGFVAVALSLIALAMPLAERHTIARCAIGLVLFAVLFQDNVAGISGSAVLFSVTGMEAVSAPVRILRFGHLRQRLAAESQRALTPETESEPEIRAIVGGEPVASLSEAYSAAAPQGLNLKIYPVIQRYSAYTPYLDEMNAAWIRDKGPRFLIFDGTAIDGRQPWTETPAMWIEVYRWYHTRLLGSHNLLLERQAEPRFTKLESLSGSQVRFGEALPMPASPQPLFWTMRCSLSAEGKLRALLFRVREVTMTVNGTDRRSREFRILPAVLQTPSLGSELPSDLAGFAAVFDPSEKPKITVASVVFDGPGAAAYSQPCSVEFFGASP